MPDYNIFVCDILDDPSTTKKYPAVLLNATVDGVSCDTTFVKQSICNFLEGKKSWVGGTDSNHNNKNSRYHIIGGSLVATIGTHPIDANLLHVAGVAFRLFCIDNFASDQLVLELCTAQTVSSLIELEGQEDGPTLVALSLGLMFMRIDLYGVNSIAYGASH
jgi:hypothetical protein